MKKIVSVIVATTILFSAVCCAASGDRTYEDGYRDGASAGYDEGYSDGLGAGKERVPIVSFVEAKEIPTVEAGGILNLTIQFKNTSS